MYQGHFCLAYFMKRWLYSIMTQSSLSPTKPRWLYQPGLSTKFHKGLLIFENKQNLRGAGPQDSKGGDDQESTSNQQTLNLTSWVEPIQKKWSVCSKSDLGQVTSLFSGAVGIRQRKKILCLLSPASFQANIIQLCK